MSVFVVVFLDVIGLDFGGDAVFPHFVAHSEDEAEFSVSLANLESKALHTI